MFSSATKQRWDIFCHVVDNYGDAGVCWRLAHQLASEFGIAVRLWIDDLAVLRKFRPDIIDAEQQSSAGVTICRWRAPLPQPLQAADVVIEAFACDVPADYRAAMRAHHSLWINLEYLSAEEWVAGCHGLPSPQSDSALKKFFFFPGFGPGTGGVLGECDLPQRRRTFQTDVHARAAFLRRFGIEPALGATVVSLFAYRDAPIEQLLRCWSRQSQPILCLVPEGQPLPAVASFFQESISFHEKEGDDKTIGERLRSGAVLRRGALTVAVLPFLSQDDYDRLLWNCAINFVRGEDSFVRAQWAALPFIWQIYAQADGAHWAKLDAFLRLYCAQLSPSSAAAVSAMWHVWNEAATASADDLDAAWRAFAGALPELRETARGWAVRLEAGPTLAAALVQFCANHV